MSTDKRALFRQWLASGQVALHPLTFPQRELWEASPVLPNDVANHICCLIDVHGVMTQPACEAALQRVVDRQEALRLSILPGKDRPVQMIRRTGEANICFHELSAAEHSDEAVEEIGAEVFAEPFDLLQGPLYRVGFFSRASDSHILVLAIHHAIADGWSLGVFVEDLCLAYVQALMGASEELPPVAMNYSAWGAAERDFWQPAELEKRGEFWKPILADRPRFWGAVEGPATASGPHRRRVTELPVEVAEAAQQLARVAGATLYSTLLAVFHVAFFRWSGQTDILVGTPVANRTSQASRETMGYCANIVPLRAILDPARPFRESLRNLHRTTVECFSNAMPFAELAAALGDSSAPGHNPIFEIRFALQNHPMPDVTLHGLSAPVENALTGTARFHLGCEITLNRDGLELVWLYRPEAFSYAEIDSLADLFHKVLDAASRSPESRITNLMN